MTHKTSRALSFCFAAVIAAGASSALATDYYWIGGAGSWTAVPAAGTAKIVADAGAGGELASLAGRPGSPSCRQVWPNLLGTLAGSSNLV